MPSDPDHDFHGFGVRASAFLGQMHDHNDRDWFRAHRAEYDAQIAAPMQALADALEPRFGEVKVFRPFRDVRFSQDKRPLKDHAALAAHGGSGGAFYLQLGAHEFVLAGGQWRPERLVLKRFRALLDDPVSAAGVHRTLESLGDDGFDLSEEGRLTGQPRGYAKDHPQIDLLRQTSLAVGKRFPTGPWLAKPKALDTIVEGWTQLGRWNTWLADHVGGH